MPISGFTKAVASVLRAERARRQLSLRDVSQATGLSTSQIGRYERAERAPNLDELEAITRALGLDPRRVVREAERRAG